MTRKQKQDCPDDVEEPKRGNQRQNRGYECGGRGSVVEVHYMLV